MPATLGLCLTQTGTCLAFLDSVFHGHFSNLSSLGPGMGLGSLLSPCSPDLEVTGTEGSDRQGLRSLAMAAVAWVWVQRP